MHTRTITCEGYARDDGLWDIEAHLIDTKTYAIDEPYRGHRPAGSHVHEMRLRLTLDADKVVRDIVVVTENAPYDACFGVAPAYRRLIGATIGGGWRRAVNEAVGGTRGCTHLRELLQPAATVAFQTMGSWPKDGEVATEEQPNREAARPHFLDGCKAWATDGPVVERLYPVHFRRPDEAGA